MDQLVLLLKDVQPDTELGKVMLKIESFHGNTWAQQIDLLLTESLHSLGGRALHRDPIGLWVRIQLKPSEFSGVYNDTCEDNFSLPSITYSSNSIHFMYGPQGNSRFFSRESWCSRDEVEGNIRTRGKATLGSFPRDQTSSALLHISTIPSTIAAKDPERARTAELYPGRDTFDFDHTHVTRNQPITVLVLSSESLAI